MQIKITKLENDIYEVNVQTVDAETSHQVTLTDEYWRELTSDISKEELIENSFKFLLGRESNTSILKTFDLKEINNYFPEFEEEIKK